MPAPHRLAGDVAGLAKSLPAFPTIVLRLLDMVEDEDTSLDALVRLARNDPVILSGLLATANGIRRIHALSDIDDPFVAASLVGVNQVRKITIRAAMNQFAFNDPRAHFLREHSQAVAIVAQELAALSGVSPEGAYVLGILHDIGQLAFHVIDPALFQAAYDRSAVDGQLTEHERAAFGVDHAELGSALAEYWKLPEDFVSAIRRHHDANGATTKLQAVVNLAETLVRALDLPSSPKNRVTRMNSVAMSILGVDWQSPAMADLFGRCRARFRQVHAPQRAT